MKLLCGNRRIYIVSNGDSLSEKSIFSIGILTSILDFSSILKGVTLKLYELIRLLKLAILYKVIDSEMKRSNSDRLQM